MQNQKIKNKLYLNALLVLVIGAICYFFIYPQYSGQGTFYSPEKNISTLLQNKTDYDSALSIANDYNNKIKKINTDYNSALNTLPIDTLNKVLPSSIDPLIIMYELTKIAALPGSDMLLTDPRFTDDGEDINYSDSNKKYNTLSITFGLQGTYDNMKYFLKTLESSERIFNVRSLDFASAEDATKSTSIFKYDITVETYYLNQKK